MTKAIVDVQEIQRHLNSLAEYMASNPYGHLQGKFTDAEWRQYLVEQTNDAMWADRVMATWSGPNGYLLALHFWREVLALEQKRPQLERDGRD